MAVTSDLYNTNDGSPTSWSAALDSITSGAEEDNVKRLFFVSAGNVTLSYLSQTDFPTANTLFSVENPGQSWNAITVGGYNEHITISDPDFTGFCQLQMLTIYLPIVQHLVCGIKNGQINQKSVECGKCSIKR